MRDTNRTGAGQNKNTSENPLIDGLATSMSGDGKHIPHGDINITLPGGPPSIAFSIRPPGLGGGCIQGGSLENITVTLGPVGTPLPPSNDSSRLGHNPHCITRDFLPSLLQAQNWYQNITD